MSKTFILFYQFSIITISLTEEPLDSAAEDAILAKDDDVEMSAADELDNWEQTVDEILDDEKAAGKITLQKSQNQLKFFVFLYIQTLG